MDNLATELNQLENKNFTATTVMKPTGDPHVIDFAEKEKEVSDGTRESHRNTFLHQDEEDDNDEAFHQKLPLTETKTISTDGKLLNSNSKDADSREERITILKFTLHIEVLRRVIWGGVLIGYYVYLGLAIYCSWSKTGSWCEGVRLLLLLTITGHLGALYYLFLKPIIIKYVIPRTLALTNSLSKKTSTKCKYVSRLKPIVIACIIIIFVAIDSSDNRMRLVSCGGLSLLLLFGYAFSTCRSKILWPQVMWGIFVQFCFGLLILRTHLGKEIFRCIGTKIQTFLAYSDQGSKFVFGYLTTGELSNGLPQQIQVFAFSVLPVTIFFSFCVSILYHYGLMQMFVLKLGWFLQKVMGTTACESVNAAANIFLGLMEAPLMIKPYLKDMTKSELHAMMTGGCSTIAGGVLAAYINFGVNASHLLSASVMSAPAALAISKLMYPETEVSKTTAESIVIDKGNERNAIEAGVNGVSIGLKIVANIVGNLIAFISFIYFLDVTLSWFGGLIELEFITFQWLISKVLTPLAFMMGVEWQDSEHVARLVGLKTVVNEFVAYINLAKLKEAKAISLRSEYIATYALCGFSNFSVIGISIGGYKALVPERLSDISSLALRAMVAGSIACLMTACIAGMLLDTPPSQDAGNAFMPNSTDLVPYANENSTIA